jgi:hypothetical protein
MKNREKNRARVRPLDASQLRLVQGSSDQDGVGTSPSSPKGVRIWPHHTARDA